MNKFFGMGTMTGTFDLRLAIKKVYGSLDAIYFEDEMYVLREDSDTFLFVSFDSLERKAFIGFGAYTEGRSLDNCIENLQGLRLRFKDFERKGYDISEVQFVDAPDGKRYELTIPLVNQVALVGLLEHLKSVSGDYSLSL